MSTGRLITSHESATEPTRHARFAICVRIHGAAPALEFHSYCTEWQVQMRQVLALYLILGPAGLFAAEKWIAPPVELKADEETDEQGNKTTKRPSYFSIYLGARAAMPLIADPTAASAAASYANTNIVRTQEIIYKGTGPVYEVASSSYLIMPALRAEWDVPFERAGFLPKWRAISMLFSFEGATSLTANVLNADGSFRYQNAQAQHLALTDVTYTGSLKVTERHQYLSPMAGIGFELGNPQGARFIGSFSLGVALQNGQRDYDLALTPQQISAGAYSDTYVITASANESYSMAFLLAGRAELGVRMRVGAKVHLAVVASCAAHYGVINYSGTGIFAERAGTTGDKNIYQKVVSSTSDEVYLGLVPGIFLALSHEL
jgi:hypothetical protein